MSASPRLQMSFACAASFGFALAAKSSSVSRCCMLLLVAECNVLMGRVCAALMAAREEVFKMWKGVPGLKVSEGSPEAVCAAACALQAWSFVDGACSSFSWLQVAWLWRKFCALMQTSNLLSVTCVQPCEHKQRCPWLAELVHDCWNYAVLDGC